MIARIWGGLAAKNTADRYVQHLKADTLPLLRKIDGYIDTKLLRRNLEDKVEFIVMTTWDSMEAIKAFSGEGVEKAVVPLEAQALLVEYELTVKQFEVENI